MSKHTPGPWQPMCDEARGKPRCLITDSAGYQVAEINPFREQWNENARLIAAAPELLRACKLFELWMLCGQQGPYCDSSLLEIVKAAIAKAEGSTS